LSKVSFVGTLVLATVSIAGAQEFGVLGNNEIAGTVGHTFVSDFAVPNAGVPNAVVRHGKGISFDVSYARILRSADWADFAVELPVVFNPDEDLHYPTNQVPEQYSSFFVTPAARLRFFPNLDLSPWFSFGGGFGHFETSSNLLFFGNNTGNRSETTVVLQGGIGLDVHIPKVTNKYRIRFEARDDWSRVPPLNVDTGKTRQHNYYLGGGLVVRF
jgi:hypothetical protein